MVFQKSMGGNSKTTGCVEHFTMGKSAGHRGIGLTGSGFVSASNRLPTKNSQSGAAGYMPENRSG